MYIADTHSDTLYAMGVQHAPADRLMITPQRLREGGVTLQVFALWTGGKGNKGDVAGIVQAELSQVPGLIAAGLRQVTDPADARDGEQCFMLSVEGGEIFEGSVERVREFHARGIRMAALTWNNENEIGYPAKGGTKNGIKPQGWAILKEMASLRMAADTSHLNEAGFWDLIDKHSQPPMASHSCAAKLCPHFRNLTDEQIRAMASRGGWIGVNFYPRFLREDGKAGVKDIADHIDHMCQLGAAKNVGFGSDFDGIEYAPVDCQSPADIPAILAELRRRGYSEEAVEDIAGRNFLNYYRRLGY